MTRPDRILGISLLLALVLVGCGRSDVNDVNDDEREQVTTVSTRPPMEDVLDRYDAMQRDMVAGLAAELPGLEWRANDDGMGMVRSGCGDDGASPTGEKVSMLKHAADGTPARQDWDRAVEIVEEIGRGYGFTDLTPVVDRDEDRIVIGEDGFGGRYRFGMAVNTILSVTTGCHEWDAVPAEGGERPSPIVG